MSRGAQIHGERDPGGPSRPRGYFLGRQLGARGRAVAFGLRVSSERAISKWSRRLSCGAYSAPAPMPLRIPASLITYSPRVPRGPLLRPIRGILAAGWRLWVVSCPLPFAIQNSSHPRLLVKKDTRLAMHSYPRQRVAQVVEGEQVRWTDSKIKNCGLGSTDHREHESAGRNCAANCSRRVKKRTLSS